MGGHAYMPPSPPPPPSRRRKVGTLSEEVPPDYRWKTDPVEEELIRRARVEYDLMLKEQQRILDGSHSVTVWAIVCMVALLALAVYCFSKGWIH